MKPTKTTPSLIRNCTNRAPLWRGFLLIALICFGFSPTARAVDPPPDGGYPNENTAEGEDALFSLTTNRQNTAVGFHALYSNNAGQSNTAVGDAALTSITTGYANTAVGTSA